MAEQTFIKINAVYEPGGLNITTTNISASGGRIILMGDDFGLIPHQTMVDVVGYLEDGIVFMKGKVTLSTRSQLNLEILKSEGKQERRNYLKVKVFMNAKLVRAFSLGKRRKPYVFNDQIQTRDLSLGGVAFFSNRTLFRKQRIEIDLNVLKPGFIAQAEVLRRERGVFRGGYRYKYGCRFLDISGEEERVLCEFVFKTQIETRKKLTHHDD